MSQDHLARLNDVASAPAYDRAAFDRHVAACRSRIAVLRDALRAARVDVERLEAARAGRREMEARVGAVLIDAQRDIERQRLELERALQEMGEETERQVTHILAAARAEVDVVRGVLAGIVPSPEAALVIDFRHSMELGTRSIDGSDAADLAI